MLEKCLAVVFLALTLQGCTAMEKEEKNLETEEKSGEKKLAPYLNACKAEIDKLCKSAGTDKGKQAQCLKQNKAKAGTNCRNAIEKEGEGKK